MLNRVTNQGRNEWEDYLRRKLEDLESEIQKEEIRTRIRRIRGRKIVSRKQSPEIVELPFTF